jgi:hypothetical protein
MIKMAAIASIVGSVGFLACMKGYYLREKKGSLSM